jgi:hypothetical protein
MHTPKSPSPLIAALPPALDLPAAAHLLGISRTSAYELVRTGEWPSPVLRLGRRIKIPTQPLLELLGLSTVESGGTGTEPRSQAG